MKHFVLLGIASAGLLGLAGCSVDLPSLPKLDGQPSYSAAANETASVESIELAFSDGRGVGAFLSSIDPGSDPTIAASQRYRVRVVFDSGNHTTLVQDGTVALAINQRVKLEGGRALPTATPSRPNLSPQPFF
jgi:hypothetical protein